MEIAVRTEERRAESRRGDLARGRDVASGRGVLHPIRGGERRYAGELRRPFLQEHGLI